MTMKVHRPSRVSLQAILAVGLMVLGGGELGVCAGPLLVVEPGEVCDLGRVKENTGSYDFLFNLRNDGDAELTIAKVRPGCGCTTVSLARKELAAGESVELKAKLKTEGNEGEMLKAIWVDSNDEKNPQCLLTIKVRLPYMERGPRLYPKGGYYTAALRERGTRLQVTAAVENCDAETPVRLLNAELPEGWTCSEPFPITVAPEQRVAFSFVRPVAAGEQVPALMGVDFVILTDYPDPAKATLKGRMSFAPLKISVSPPSK